MSDMSFEKYEGSSRGRVEKDHPTVKMWASGKLAFNDAAVSTWLDDADHVAVFTHTDDAKVGLGATPEENAGQRHVYSLHTYGSYTGKLLQLKKLLRDLGCTKPEESLELDAKYDDENELLVVDFDPLT